MKVKHTLLLFLAGLTVASVRPAVLLAQGSRADYERASGLREATRDKVLNERVAVHWLADNTRFWYRSERKDGHRYAIVNATDGTKSDAFDHGKLAVSLAAATGESLAAAELPIDWIEFDAASDGALAAMRFNAKDKGWRCDLGTYELAEADRLTPPREERRRGGRRGRWRGFGDADAAEMTSPDGRWIAFVKDHNLHVRASEGEESFALSAEGTEEDGYGSEGRRLPVFWSPDSRRLVALRTAKAQDHTVHLIESTPDDQLQPKLHSRQYLKPGDRISVSKPHLFDLQQRQETPVSDELFPNPWSIRDLRWTPDSRRFTFLYNQRGHQVLRVVSVDAETGEAGTVIDERSDTFIDYAHKTYADYLEDSGEMVWMSERDGWNHLYLHDSRTGQLKSRITRGEWVVRGVDRVDEAARQIWFRASGIFPEQDPYYVHYCRSRLDGTDLVILTDGNGTHEVTYSPDERFLIDRYSRVDLPPVTELRRATDGSLVCEIERADWSALLETGWPIPERFVAKGRDGKTDIYGVIFRPSNLDPAKKYPVIEQIYAGPHGSHVPKSFRSYHGPQAMAELGFVLVQIDGMGTSDRSKAFHDVCWRNLKDAGFPDRIPWMQAAAAKYPYMDLERVGIYGGSAGGQNTLSGLLFHPEFYKVGVADCGCHDNRMDKIWWNELWMGWPVGPEYADNSNVTHAARLQGKLLLTVGEMDTNVDPASTLQVVDALIKADRDFDFVMVPGGGHGVGTSSPYMRRRMRDFFVRHLHHVEPRWEPTVDEGAVSGRADGESDPEPSGGGGPFIEHVPRDVEGWQVRVDTQLIDGPHAELGSEALRILAGELFEITKVMTAERLPSLREVPIWLDFEHALESLQYHPSAGWLRRNGYDPAMEKGVHIPRARRLVGLVRSNHQPWVLLHELAHAYHDRVLGFDHAPIRAAFDRVREAGIYESVLHIRGKPARHYALSDHKEFFAEMTEAYFGTNDFYPFVRAELREVDAETCELLEAVWGKLP